MEGIEIYIRPSGDRALLNIYVPAALRDAFLNQLTENGTFSDTEASVLFEMHVQSQWHTESEGDGEHPTGHVRVPISAINLVRVS